MLMNEFYEHYFNEQEKKMWDARLYVYIAIAHMIQLNRLGVGCCGNIQIQSIVLKTSPKGVVGTWNRQFGAKVSQLYQEFRTLFAFKAGKRGLTDLYVLRYQSTQKKLQERDGKRVESQLHTYFIQEAISFLITEKRDILSPNLLHLGRLQKWLLYKWLSCLWTALLAGELITSRSS